MGVRGWDGLVGAGDDNAGRAVALVWMFAGLFLLACFTAGIATTFTIDEIEGGIRGVEDLPGNVVAVPHESEVDSFLARQVVTTRAHPTAEDAHTALLDGEVDVMDHDAAILQHRVRTDDAGRLRLAGAPFHQQRYGFVVPVDDRLRERINVALLELVESGEHAALHEQWFGRAPSPAGQQPPLQPPPPASDPPRDHRPRRTPAHHRSRGARR